MTRRTNRTARAAVLAPLPALLTVLLAVLVTAAGAGCHIQETIPLLTPIVVRQAPTGDLTIHNALDRDITVLPAPAHRGGSPILIPPGQAARVPFGLEEIARLEPLDPKVPEHERRYMLGARTATLASPPGGATPYFALEGVDGAVRVAFDGQTHTYLVRLDECLWEDPPPEGFVLFIDAEPEPGLPLSLCP